MEKKAGKEDIKISKEQFIIQYARKKGWDPNNLTTQQMLEIVEQQKYKR